MSEVAWAAGLFEGEGSIGTRCSNDREYIRFSLKTTDEDVIRRFASAMGAGAVSGPRFNADYKPIWSWEAASQRDIKIVSALLEPYLGERRRNALERAWHRYSNNPPIRAISPYGRKLREAA